MSRLDYPATGRNREPLWAVLSEVLPASGTVLEVASGSGQHAAWFAAQRPTLHWHPTSYEDEERASIDAWCGALPNVAPARSLNVLTTWPAGPYDGLFCANMIHIAPWSCTPALMAGAARVLRPGAPFVLYGPFHEAGMPTSDGNARFDHSLRLRDPSWGVRDRGAVVAQAQAAGLSYEGAVPLPANNQCLLFRA